MIALWLSVALAQPHSSAGVSVGAASIRTAARHSVAPSLGGWVLHRNGFAVGGEFATVARRASGELYTHRRREVTGAFLVGGGVDSGAFGVDWLAGPAGSLAWGRLKSDTIDLRFVEPTAGIRLRNSLDMRPSESVVVRIGMGAMTRGLQRWDFDVLMGIGGAW